VRESGRIQPLFGGQIDEEERVSVKSVADLERAARAYLDARNDDAKPFVWTADAGAILGRVDRNRAAISKSGH
jgi:hypothetical protein